jgi:diguanylate cyclase (GGDEF)-like protein
VLTKEPVFIASPADPRLAASEREEMIKWREQAMLIVPLVARDEVVGLVEISETREGRAITPEQVSTIVSVCRFIALALHDADKMRAQEESERRLASLHESSRAVAGAASLEDALAVVTRCAGEALGVSECVAFEHDAELDAIVMRARWERTPGGRDRSGEPLPLAESPMGHSVLESGRSLFECLSDPKLDPAIRADLDSRGEKSRLTVPMPSTDGPVGLLTFGDAEREREFPGDDLAVASALAGLAGEAVAGARLLRRLGRLSEADAMTGLANHRELHESLALEQARAEHHGSHFSAVILGLDGLKSLNDTYGHPAGDEVLRLVASMLSERTGTDDIVGRWAGDKFLLILAATAAAQAGLFAEELCAALAEAPYATATGEQVPIRVSFGIAAYPEDAPDASGLAAVAEANLLASKPVDDDGATGDEQEGRPRDTGDEAASGPLVEVGMPSVAAERQDRADESSTDESSTDERAADEPAAPTKPAVRDDGTIDQAEMRSRIEETRTRLKVKAFDAMIRGGAALLSRDGGEAPGPTSDDPSLDSDLEGMVDGAFSEQEY